VFRSKAALAILKKTAPHDRIYQKDLIATLGFSNKTVITALRTLVAVGILEQGMEKRQQQGRTVWVKWYTPTFQGKWLTLLLQPPTAITRDEVREIVPELFRIYMENILNLCREYDLTPTFFETTMTQALLNLLQATPTAPSRSQVAVYGSAAVDTTVVTDQLADQGEAVYLPDVQVSPGGSAANVAVALQRLGVLVSFAGAIGSDPEGVLLLQAFQKEGVDTSDVVIHPHHMTVRTFITIDPMGRKRIHVLGGNNPALSLTSPHEIHWNTIEDSQIVYMGEVFLELAELIASYAKGQGKQVIYRPGLPQVTHHAVKVRNVLRHVDILILNQHGWHAIKETADADPTDLLARGPEVVIVTQGSDGCETYSNDEHFASPGYVQNAIDTTGAGDAFAAGFIAARLKAWSLRDCIRYALAVSAISVTKRGARTALPTPAAVTAFLQRVDHSR
jgi:ribokinase